MAQILISSSHRIILNVTTWLPSVHQWRFSLGIWKSEASLPLVVRGHLFPRSDWQTEVEWSRLLTGLSVVVFSLFLEELLFCPYLNINRVIKENIVRTQEKK